MQFRFKEATRSGNLDSGNVDNAAFPYDATNDFLPATDRWLRW